MLLAVISSCYKKTKPIEQMTNTELLEEYQRLNKEILNPKENYVKRSSGNPFNPDVTVIESKDQYIQRMIDDQLKVEQELSGRNLSSEEQRQYDSIMAPKYEIMQKVLMLPSIDSNQDMEGPSD